MSYNPAYHFVAVIDTAGSRTVLPSLGPYAFGSTRVALPVGATVTLFPRSPDSATLEVNFGELTLRRVADADGTVTALGPAFDISYNPSGFEVLDSGAALIFDDWPADTADFSQQDPSTVEILTAGWFSIFAEIDVKHS